MSEEKFRNDLKEVRDGKAYIQNKLSYLNTDDREIFMSGYCVKGWDKLFDYTGEDAHE